MAITASKPAINIREKLAELDQPQGIKGTEVLRADTADEARNAIGARGRKNLIINGDFKISQRGDFTTASAAVDGDYYLDRWTVVFDTVGVTKQDTGNAMKVVATSSGTGSLRIRHKFEDTTYLSGKTVTISCQLKSNSSNARINMYADGWQSATSNHTGGGAWESVSVTLTIPTGVSTELSAHFGIDGVSSANVSVTSGDYCEIKECQLELGDQATEFEHRSYGEELALCQRYYQRISGSGDAFTVTGKGQGTAKVDGTIPLSVPLRAAPTMNSINSRAFSDSGSFASSSSTAPTANSFNANNTLLAFQCGGFSGLVNNEVYLWGPLSNALEIDSEL
jgi:hypothetical protein